MTEIDLPTFIDALAFAADKHRDQRRKGSDAPPYINHPIEVAKVLAREGGISDLTILAAAVLHDTIEDTQTTADELSRRFGKTVTGLVQEVTDDKSLPKTERKRLQVEHSGSLTHSARLIKLADKICNVRDVALNPPENWPLQRRIEYFDWARAVVDGLRGTHPALEAAFDTACEQRPRGT